MSALLWCELRVSDRVILPRLIFAFISAGNRVQFGKVHSCTIVFFFKTAYPPIFNCNRVKGRQIITFIAKGYNVQIRSGLRKKRAGMYFVVLCKM